MSAARTLEGLMRDGANALSQSKSPWLDARVLASHAIGLSEAELIAQANAPVDPEKVRLFRALIDRRREGEPVAYLTGVKEFWGLPFAVGPGVLIPRPDSECLIEALITAGPARYARVLDLGVGSGALLAALLSELREATGVGVDRSQDAARQARCNLDKLGLRDRAEIIVGDWTAPLSGRFDVIVANAPYIPEGDRADLEIDVSRFEPSAALFAGADGLAAYRALIPELPRVAGPESLITLEYGTGAQRAPLESLAAAAFPNGRLTLIRDLSGRERGLLLDNRAKRD
ncbi:MAG: peptide chain release factor N(5)-glutamine methyltransferase [Pseudomonadota bacterium]